MTIYQGEAIFHQILMKHANIPPRFVHKDTQLGGYHIPSGTEIMINIYGCNMDQNKWDDPSEWKPEGFLDEDCDMADLFKTMAFGAGKNGGVSTGVEKSSNHGISLV